MCLARTERATFWFLHKPQRGENTTKYDVEEMDSCDAPNTVRELQKFLGSFRFHRDSIPNYAIIAKDLTEMLKKYKPFTWGPKQREAFENLKCAVKSGPAKTTLDVTKPLVLVTDVSGDGWWGAAGP